MINKVGVKNFIVALLFGFSFSALAIAQNNSNTELQLAQTTQESKKYKTEFSEYTIPDLTLINHNAQSVSLQELLAEDKPIVLNFIFTSCPTICPVLTSTFAKLQSSLQTHHPKVQMISVSIDPEHDTPTVLHDYAEKFKANDNWAFITGNTKDIESLQKSFESFRGDKMSHVPVYFMRAATSKKWLRIEGFPSIKNMINEYRQLNPA